MGEPSKRLKRLLREYASRAHEEELRRALVELSRAFDEWSAGKISCQGLSARIHEFHDGTARDIFKSYSHRLVEAPLARAIAGGILDKSQLPPELVEYLARSIEFYETESANS
jgi:hypothetical protein